MKGRVRGLSLAALAGALIAAWPGGAAAQEPADGDSAFAELQRRGEAVMGVDQSTLSHRFEPLPDGGRIVLVRDGDDPRGEARIRDHLREIAGAFAAGDFRSPALIHEGEPPGAGVMRRKASAIAYSVEERPRGGELRMSTADPEAVSAIHEFLAFQRREHRAAGADEGRGQVPGAAPAGHAPAGHDGH